MTKWKKNNNYTFLYSPVALLVLFILFLFFGYRIFGLIKENKETAHKKDLVLDRIDDLEKRKSSLIFNMSKIETQEGKEKIIRDKYQFVKEDEKMVTIVDGKDNVIIDGQEKVKHGFGNWIKGLFNK
jgi:cell division protein FtsB